LPAGCALGRALNVFPICKLINRWRKPAARIPEKHVWMMWVGWCKAKRFVTRVESAWFQRLKLICADLISRFAFNLNLRPYLTVSGLRGAIAFALASSSIKDVGVESGRVIRTATLIIVLFTVGSGR